MLAYVFRRILISIPVVLVASFVLFVFVRETFDPTARLRNVRDPAAIERGVSSSRATGATAPAPASRSPT